uniref:Uncharacterized protein n=1 Tax=Tetranychus urticae TaxID=32264 RepID=T1L1B2_TETUR
MKNHPVLIIKQEKIILKTKPVIGKNLIPRIQTQKTAEQTLVLERLNDVSIQV